MFAVLLSPFVGHLRFSVLLILLPPDCDSILATFVGRSCSVNGLPVILLPLRFTALFASGTVNTIQIVWHNQGLKSCLNLSDCIFVGSEGTFRIYRILVLGLDVAGHLSEFEQLDDALVMDDASGFLAEDHRVSWFS